MEGYQLGGGRERREAKVQGLRSINWQVQKRQGDVKNRVGNREAKELICTAQVHELKWRDCWREWGY